MFLSIPQLFLAFVAIQPVISTYSFINPASYGGQTSFANNNVYAEKAILEVQWTVGSTDEDATVTLWQVNTTSTTATSDEPEFIGDLEYLAEGQAPTRNSRRWIVITDKDLTISPVFLMMIFVTGSESASDWTVYFNITSGEAITTASTSATATVSTGTAIASASRSASPSSSSISSSSSASASDISADTMSTSAKVGLGVGIPAAAIAGFLAGLGFLVCRRGRKGSDSNNNNSTNTNIGASGGGGLQQHHHQQDMAFMDNMHEHGRSTVGSLQRGHVASDSMSKISQGYAISPRPASATNNNSNNNNNNTHYQVYEASNEPATVSELYAPHNYMERRY